MQARIIGGHASTPGQYPWVAMLATSGSVQCGAIIVDEYHVLTAGHCLDEYVAREGADRAGRFGGGGAGEGVRETEIERETERKRQRERGRQTDRDREGDRQI